MTDRTQAQSEAEKIVVGFPWYPYADEEFYAQHIALTEKLEAIRDDAPELIKALRNSRRGPTPEIVRASKIAKVPIEGGKYELSVVCSPIAYSNGVDTYEVMVETVSGERVKGPWGHLGADEVVAKLEEWKGR